MDRTNLLTHDSAIPWAGSDGQPIFGKTRSGFGPKKVHQGLLDSTTPHSDVTGTANEPYQYKLNDFLGRFKETEVKDEVRNAILLAFVAKLISLLWSVIFN